MYAIEEREIVLASGEVRSICAIINNIAQSAALAPANQRSYYLISQYTAFVRTHTFSLCAY